MSENYRHPLTGCPLCGHKLDAAGSVPDGQPERAPQAGDWSVCIECASPLVYIEIFPRQGVGLRAATPADWAGLLPDERRDVERMLAAVRSLRR